MWRQYDRPKSTKKGVKHSGNVCVALKNDDDDDDDMRREQNSKKIKPKGKVECGRERGKVRVEGI